MPTDPLIPKRAITPFHELNASTLQEGLKFVQRCQRRTPSKRFMAFLQDLEHSYRQCLLYEEVVENSGPGECLLEKSQDNEARKRKIQAAEFMLESQADSLNRLSRRLIDVLRDLFELELLAKYGDYFGALWNDMKVRQRVIGYEFLHHKFVRDVVATLDKETKELQQWSKDPSSPYPDQDYTSQIKTLAYEMGIEKAELVFRLRVYASRNTPAHSGDLNMRIEKCHFAAVATILAGDYNRLEEVLLKVDRVNEREHWENALKKFASLYFIDFDFSDSENFFLTQSARDRSFRLIQEAKNAKLNAQAKAVEEAGLLQKQKQGTKKERQQKTRESSAEYQVDAANHMDKFFQTNPNHELWDVYQKQKRHYARLESEEAGKELWKGRAEAALGLLEHLQKSRLDWDDVMGKWKKIEEDEESIPADFEAMRL